MDHGTAQNELQAYLDGTLAPERARAVRAHLDGCAACRAELALHGVEAHIQKAVVDGRIYYRVRIGPTDDLDQLNMIRSRLRAAQIDAVRLREVD